MTISILGIISTTLRRRNAFVRAAFTSQQYQRHGHGTGLNRAAFATTTTYTNTINAPARNKYSSTTRYMSSTAAATTDEDLDSALDEILGGGDDNDVDVDKELESEIDDLLNEALSEAENPAVDDKVGGRGHIEGSHPFPKELVEEQVRVLLLYSRYGLQQLIIYIVDWTHSYSLFHLLFYQTNNSKINNNTEGRRFYRSKVPINI